MKKLISVLLLSVVSFAYAGVDEGMEAILKAAEQGHAIAQYNLGVMYGTGKGVPKNAKIAYILFNIAASKGDDNAVKGRDMVLNILTPADRADAQRISTRLYNSKNFATDLRKLLNGQK